MQKYRERYNTTGIFECKLYPGVEKCIRTLKEQGYRIGMASSKPEVSCKRILEHFGILPLFDDVVGATFDGTRDKKSEILKEVMHRWSHIPKSEMCLIGDTMFDVNGGERTWNCVSCGQLWFWRCKGNERGRRDRCVRFYGRTAGHVKEIIKKNGRVYHGNF